MIIPSRQNWISQGLESNPTAKGPVSWWICQSLKLSLAQNRRILYRIVLIGLWLFTWWSNYLLMRFLGWTVSFANTLFVFVQYLLVVLKIQFWDNSFILVCLRDLVTYVSICEDCFFFPRLCLLDRLVNFYWFFQEIPVRYNWNWGGT